MKRRDFLRNILVAGAGLALAPELALGRLAEASWHTDAALPGVAVQATHLQFRSLENRRQTDALIFHHIGNTDADVSAATVHRWHVNNGWAGTGYHSVIRKDGPRGPGRPRDTLGAHCYGENYHTIGINIVGNFEVAEPNAAQLRSAARLAAALCRLYGFAPSGDTIFGHRDFNATACPGENLYVRLPELIRAARQLY